MNIFTATFLHFLLVTASIMHKLHLVQSIHQHVHHGKPVPSKRVQIEIATTQENPNLKIHVNDNAHIDITSKAKPPPATHHTHRLMPNFIHRHIELGEMQWEPNHHAGHMPKRRHIQSGEIMQWEPIGVIIGEAAYDMSGQSIAMSDDGNIIAIGETWHNNFVGRVRVFSLTNTNDAWKQIGNEINGKESHEYFGWSLDISADGMRMIIGGFGSISVMSVVRIYHNSNDEWLQVGGDLQGTHPLWGYRVAMSSDGTVIAVGGIADDNNGSDSGSVSMYSENAGSWQLVGSRLYGDGANDWFGNSVALSGDGLILAVGAPGSSNGKAGYVKICKYRTGTDGGRDLVKCTKLNGHPSGDHFGHGVSVSKDASHLAVSGYNMKIVKVYKVSKDEIVDLLQVGNDVYVRDERASVSISNDGRYLIVGDPYNFEFGRISGRAQVFQLNGEVLDQMGEDLHPLDGSGISIAEVVGGHMIPEPDPGDLFGYSVAISADGSTVAVGAPDSDLEGKTWTGYVRVFKLVQQPSQLPTMLPTQLPTHQLSIPGGMVIFVLCIVAVIATFIHIRRKRSSNAMNANHSPSTELVPIVTAYTSVNYSSITSNSTAV